MIGTAPGTANGRPFGVGDKILVAEPGERARLLHYGEAIDDEATPTLTENKAFTPETKD